MLAELAKTGAKVSAAYRGSLLIQVGKLDEAIAECRKGQDAKGLDGVLEKAPDYFNPFLELLEAGG